MAQACFGPSAREAPLKPRLPCGNAARTVAASLSAGSVVPTPPPRRPPLQAADLQGLSQVVIDATVGVVDLVERMHHTIAQRSGIVGAVPNGSTRGITGLVYRSVRGGTRLTGRALDLALAAIARQWPGGGSSPAREAALAALNGLCGDHLEASANPLAIPARLRHDGQPLTLQRDALAARLAPNDGRILLLVHGLCMNDLQWTRDGHDHGRALARDLGFTPVHLHHNSGRHVSHNGRDLAQLLQTLVEQWPRPVTELVIVGHSMGGLVARSACHLAAQQAMSWPGVLRGLVCLGTPHHGAPLERGGHVVDRLLGISPYVAPFARLGRARSAGITDLRFGHVQDADWQGDAPHRDQRLPTPLPTGVPTYLMAATTAEHIGSLRSTLLGDGLVPVDSALGRHADPTLDLGVPPQRQFVLTGANHWDLLNRAEAYRQLHDWLVE